MSNDLKGNIERMEKELAEMKSKLEDQKSGYIMGDGKYSVYGDGAVLPCGESKNYFLQGNSFSKKEHAKTLVAMREKWGLFLRAAIEIADGWEPDWNNGLQRKYYVFIDRLSGKFGVSVLSSTENPMTVYLPTKEAAQRLADWANENLRMT